jgi:hypothetical protein
MVDTFLDFEMRFMLPSFGVEFHPSSRRGREKVTGGGLEEDESARGRGQDARGKKQEVLPTTSN